MRKIFQILLLALMLMFSSASAYEINDNYIEYEGIVYPSSEKDPNKLRRMAELIAYQRLAEQVAEVNVDSSSTVRNVCELDETANFKVQTILRNLRYVSEFRDSDGSFHAIIRVYLHSAPNSLASAVLKEVPIEDFPPPKFTSIHSEIHYSGLIIDCRGLNLSEAIIPTIKADDGTEIYAYKNVGYRAAVDKGMVTYSSSLDSPRAGNSPLVIKAVSVSGKCDVVISSADGDKVLSANQVAKFLDNCAVVFVR